MEITQSFNKSFIHIYPNQKSKLHEKEFCPNRANSVYYHVVSKTKDRWGERVFVEIDRNLSHALIHTAFKDQESLSIAVTRLESDVASNKWKITVDLDYVLDHQEHISQVDWFYMPQHQGTWDKRLKAVEEEFKTWVKAKSEDFQEIGFTPNNIYHIRNLVSYLTIENKKKKFLSTFSEKSDMNTIMIVYEILGGNIKLDLNQKVDLFCFPYHHREYSWYNTVIPTIPSLSIKEKDLLEKSIEIFNTKNLTKHIHDFIDNYRKLDLQKFKAYVENILN